MNKEDYNNKIIDDAVEILNDDGVIIVPTDTVYGLAVSSKSETAINKIYSIKNRNFDKRLPIVVDTYERLMNVCEINKDTLKKLQPFYPGKITLVLKKKNSEETVAVRMINNEIINKIIEKLDCPLCLTSANVSNKETSDDIMEIIDEFDGMADMVIMGNKTSKVCSTIIDLTKDNVKLLREGAVPFESIKEALK